jgi:hypothetical protein
MLIYEMILFFIFNTIIVVQESVELWQKLFPKDFSNIRNTIRKILSGKLFSK